VFLAIGSTDVYLEKRITFHKFLIAVEDRGNHVLKSFSRSEETIYVQITPLNRICKTVFSGGYIP
jgi:hypothetical protein